MRFDLLEGIASFSSSGQQRIYIQSEQKLKDAAL